jgi:undecaprenyl-diphosphatase
MIEFLYSIELAVFYFFNHTLSSAGLDRFFITITDVGNWYIAYIILLGISFKYGGRKGKLAVAGIILLIAITDQLNHTLVKETFQRLRPCNSLPDVLTPAGCGGTFSFPSNHAVNNFAAASFFFLLFRNLKWVLFITAFLVSISRIYLGMHFPSDVLAGAVFGAAWGLLFGIIILKIDNILQIRSEKQHEQQHSN